MKKSNAMTPNAVPPRTQTFAHGIRTACISDESASRHAATPIGSSRPNASRCRRSAGASPHRSARRCAHAPSRVRRSISPGSSTSPPATTGGDALHPRRHPRDLGLEFVGAAKRRRIEDHRHHVVHEPPRGRVRRGFVVQPAGQRAREDLAEHRQPVTLVAGDGQQRAFGRAVEASRDRGSAGLRRRSCSLRGNVLPWLSATWILPSAMADVEMSRISGAPSAVGAPAAIGLADSRRSLPPNGATRMPNPDVFTKWIDASPACAACSAHAPMRPR